MSDSCSITARATFTGAIGVGFPANGLLSRCRYCPIASDGSRASASVTTVILRFERRILEHSMSNGNGRVGTRAVTTNAPGRGKVLVPPLKTQQGGAGDTPAPP